MTFLEKLSLTWAWLCGDRNLRQLLDEALSALEDAERVIEAAKAYCEAPGGEDTEELGALATAVGAYLQKHR
jgi:hypothetical protein